MKLTKTISILLASGMIASNFAGLVSAEELGESVEVLELGEVQQDMEDVQQEGEISSFDEDEIIILDSFEEDPYQEAEEIVIEDTCEGEALFETESYEGEIEEELPNIVITDGMTNSDNEGLFNAYANRQLYGEPYALGTFAGDQLTGINKKVFDALKPIIKQIAAGERASTEIKIKVTGTEKVFNNSNVSIIIKSLLIDCPYEMYWYDKSATGGCGGSIAHSPSTGYITNITLRFSVEAEYSMSGVTGTYQMNTSLPQAVGKAKINAQNIVNKYAGKSDYDKLLGYKNEICAMTSYNYSAVYNDQIYGNPWQLIWALDGDPNTLVVCEGYSKAFQYLCDLSTFSDIGIMCNSVIGKTSEKHMWNVVTMEDGYHYLVDLTNCDAGYNLFMVGFLSGSAESGYVISSGKGSGTIVYHYDSNYLPIYGDMAKLAPFNYHKHVAVIDKAVEATCKTTGLTEGSHCSVYGEVLTEQEVIPVNDNHIVKTWNKVKKPTVFDEGLERGDCSLCNKAVSRTINKLEATVTLNATGTLPLQKGKKVTLKATGLQAGDKISSWKSSNSSIAKVSSKGVVTGLKKGKAKITVTLASGVKASVTIKVQTSQVQTSKIVIGIPTKVTISKGETVKMNTTVTPISSTNSITYRSANEKIATVSSKGTIKGIKAGTTKITVKSGGRKIVLTVEVK